MFERCVYFCIVGVLPSWGVVPCIQDDCREFLILFLCRCLGNDLVHGQDFSGWVGEPEAIFVQKLHKIGAFHLVLLKKSLCCILVPYPLG